MGNIFMPLTWQVWVLHAFLVTFCGAAIWLMEATSPAELGRYSAKWRQRRGSAFTRALLGRPSGEHDRPLVEGGDSNELRSVDGLLTSIYAAWRVGRGPSGGNHRGTVASACGRRAPAAADVVVGMRRGGARP